MSEYVHKVGDALGKMTGYSPDLGVLWRSDQMTLCQLIVQSDAAYQTLSELGELDLIQFRDLRPEVNAFHRTFVNEIKQCDELMRKLRFLTAQAKELRKNEPEQEEDSSLLLSVMGGAQERDYQNMVDLDHHLTTLESETKQINTSLTTLQRSYNELLERQEVLRAAGTFFTGAAASRALRSGGDGDVESSRLNAGAAAGAGIGTLTGTLRRDRVAIFERMLWRSTRGNVFIQHIDIPLALQDPATNESVFKTVFIVFYQGSRSLTKLQRLCEVNGATMHPCPQNPSERQAAMTSVSAQLNDLRTVLDRTIERKQAMISAMELSLPQWCDRVFREKTIFATLNMFDFDPGRKCLVGEGWVPTAELPLVREALLRASRAVGASVPSVLQPMEPTSRDIPPTRFRTNMFTAGFQGIVDSYGTPTYQEANPTVFAVTTFPFLFAVMFGDIGHGIILALFGALLVYRERAMLSQKLDQMVGMLFGGRYLLLCMGILSIYTGFMYNEAFSIPIPLFPSAWKTNPEDPHGALIRKGSYVYPFGVDWEWKNTATEILFYNSLKMKFSIIVGVTHMSLGIICSAWNAGHFKRPKDWWFQFLPQIIMMISLFGYLCFLVILKWLMPAEETSQVQILILFINMFLRFGQPLDQYDAAGNLVATDSLFTGQRWIQIILVLIAVVCVPWMLVVKPTLIWFELRKKNGHGHGGAAGGHGKPSDPDYKPLMRGRLHSDDEEDPFGVTDAVVDPGLSGFEAKPALSGFESRGKQKSPASSASVAPAAPAAAAAGAAAAHGGEEGGHGDHEDFSEIVVHQVIGTIEFVLGTVSNTASYLRLWALSLAHSKLSDVFWKQVLVTCMGLSGTSGFIVGSVVMFIALAVWTSLTVGVLLLMESLSAFLHALRLHWVEFQNKFFQGTGKAWMPFTFHPPETEESEDAAKS